MNKTGTNERDYLAKNAALTTRQLSLAQQTQQLHGGSLLDNIVNLGLLSQEEASHYYGDQIGMAFLSLNELVADPEALALFTPDHLKKWQAAPIRYQDNQLTLGLVQPQDLWVLDQLEHYLAQHQDVNAHSHSLSIKLVLINPAELGDFLARSYNYKRGVAELISEALELSPQQVKLNQQDDFRHPIVRLVDNLFIEAVKQGASDVHFEPEQAFVQLRFRLDGVLVLQDYLPQELWPAILARIKILSGLDVTEHRRPQDGRFELMLMGKNIDFRVSSLPGMSGENLVLRILDQQKTVLNLSALGFDSSRETALRRWLAQPAGVVLVVGPTGSGKTTSLYAMLALLNQQGVNIMTLEDPIEYRLLGLRQTQVNADFGVSFQTGLRAILRQDPDIILVGEIRDAETAHLAFQAAMTGHLVLSTLHCDRASQARYRLADLGVSETIIEECLLGVMAQRLVRLCDADKAGGYSGRQALIELISRWPEDKALGDFYSHGQELLIQGITDQAELQRATGTACG